jgi:hypothetical protein
MARVNKADVSVLLEIDDTLWNASFLTMAAMLVDEEITVGALSEARLTEIERNLAAHFYCLKDVRSSSEGAGGVSVSYAVSIGQGLAGTSFGQTAMLLDSTGSLTAMNVRKGKTRCVVEAISGYGERALIDGQEA